MATETITATETKVRMIKPTQPILSCSSSSYVARSPPKPCTNSASDINSINQDPIINSGTTGNYFPLSTTLPLLDKVPTSNPVRVTVTNGQTMTSTHEAHLPFGKDLPPDFTRVDLFPTPMEASLISVGRLADAGFKTTFDKHRVTV